jgi:phosphatidylglycerol:prolipoprotein diacylglycerol transferase
MEITPIGIQLGPIFLHYYGLILVGGAFAAGWLAAREAVRRGRDPEPVWDVLLWVLIGGILGARIWHIFTPPASSIAAGRDVAYYLNLTNLLPVFQWGATVIQVPAALAINQGGLGIPGGVIGGVIALWIFCRRRGLNFLEFTDTAAPGLILAQAIGRWGNFINQEVYGAPTTLPWGLTIDAVHRVPGFEDPALRFHPLFLYESLGNLLICGLLLYLARRFEKQHKPGDIFLVYLIAYPALRFFLDFLRLDNNQILGLNTNQTIMLVVAVVAAFILAQRHRRLRRHELKAVQDHPTAGDKPAA